MLYYFLLIYLVFGVFFRAFLNWEYIDEITVVVLLSVAFVKTSIVKNIEFKVLGLYALFCIVYSYFFSVNRNTYGMLLDAFQQFKPFSIFYAVWALCEKKLSKKQCKVLEKLSLWLAIISFVIIVANGDIHAFYGHPGNFSNSILDFAIVHYFVTGGKKYKQSFIILLIGIVGGRSKMYGEIVAAAYTFFLMKNKIKFNFKYILIGFIVLIGILYVAREKISLYLYGDELVDADKMARTLFYTNMPYLLAHYFPFGSGLASYATWFSGVFYSPLYESLNLSEIYGIRRDFFDFVADTYYPSLAEFGVVGIFFFLFYWYRRYKVPLNGYNYKLKILIIFFILIECTTSPFLVSAAGVIPMVILAMNEKLYKV